MYKHAHSSLNPESSYCQSYTPEACSTYLKAPYCPATLIVLATYKNATLWRWTLRAILNLDLTLQREGTTTVWLCGVYIAHTRLRTLVLARQFSINGA